MIIESNVWMGFNFYKMTQIIQIIREYLSKKEGWTDGFKAKIVEQFERDYVGADKENKDYIYHIILFGKMHGCNVYFF